MDSAGAVVRVIYAKRPPDYAVYGTDSKVTVQYADDPTKEQTQRTMLVKLNTLRTGINNLIEDWRSGKNENNKAKVARYDGRVANALIASLEEDPDGAADQLQKTKDDIVDERTSSARFEYLMAAAAACLACIVFCTILSWSWKYTFSFQAAYVGSLWLAAGTGAAGAFFSIAIAIRGRTVLTDLRVRDNFSDAALRIFIGAMAGALLISLLLSGLISLKIQTQEFHVTGIENWLSLMIAAFIGGFSERLVPDLLAKTVDAPASAVVTPSSAGEASKPQPKQQVMAAQHTGEAPDSMEAVDNCPTLAEITDAEATQDADLPASVGGVAQTAAPQV